MQSHRMGAGWLEMCLDDRPYLWGRKFTVGTDHASLVWLLRTSQPKGQVARWVETLADFDFDVVHRKGLKHNSRCRTLRQSIACLRIQSRCAPF